MATIVSRKQGKGVSYQVKVRLKGLPCKTETFTRKTDAVRWASATETHLREARHFPDCGAARHTLFDLVARYQRDVLPLKPKNAKNQDSQLEWWKTQLGKLPLADITPAKVGECRDLLLTVPKSNGKLRSTSTAVRYLAVLSHAFSIGMREWGWVQNNPVRMVSKPREPRGRVRYLHDDERARLLIACRESRNPSLYTIVVLALTTAMRRGEIMWLRWPDVDFERQQLTLHHTKNNERRVVPLVGHALALLRELNGANGATANLVFASRNSRRPQDIDTAWTNAVERAELIDFRFHDLRHTAASYLAMQGCSTLELAELLGHKTLQMVKRYSHLSTAHTRRSLTKLDSVVFPIP